MPESIFAKLVVGVPGKIERHGPVKPLGVTVTVPVITKSRVTGLTVQELMSRLSWQVKLPNGLLCTYCANSQSAVLPEGTTPPKDHHPQNPKLLPPGVTAVPANAVCQFSLP